MAIRNVSHLPLSLSLRVFPLFPFAVIFSSAFFSLFPSLGLFDLRAEAKERGEAEIGAAHKLRLSGAAAYAANGPVRCPGA